MPTSLVSASNPDFLFPLARTCGGSGWFSLVRHDVALPSNVAEGCCEFLRPADSVLPTTIALSQGPADTSNRVRGRRRTPRALSQPRSGRVCAGVRSRSLRQTSALEVARASLSVPAQSVQAQVQYYLAREESE